MTSSDEHIDQNDGRDRRRGGRSRLHLTAWAAADKALPMVYGVAVLLMPLKLLTLEEFGVWTAFQAVFLSISLIGDFFLLQPMVKLASEHNSDERPIVTAGMGLYFLISLLLAAPLTLFPGIFSDLFKTGQHGTVAFTWLAATIAATLLRNVSIRLLQIDYRITQIFLLDLFYFGSFIVQMIIGTMRGTLDDSIDMVRYNLISLALSSIVGAVLSGRKIIPSIRRTVNAARQIITIGTHQGGTGLMTIAQQNFDVLIVSGTRGSVAAGTYSFARIFYRTFESLREAGQLLLISETSHAYSRDDVERVQDITVMATAALVMLLYPVIIVLILVAPIGIPLIKQEYSSSVGIFQWLIASGFAMPFIIVPSAVLLGIGKTRELFRGMAIGTVVLLASGLAMTYMIGPAGMAIGVLLGNLTTALLLTRKMDLYIDFSVRAVLKRSRGLGSLVRKRIREFRS